MFNKSKKAISNLKQLLNELENISNVQQGNTWKAKLKDTLNLYIGENSSLSNRLDNLYFTKVVSRTVPGVIGVFDDHVYEPSNKSNFIDIINNSISHIEANGLSSGMKSNFLGGFNNTEIISGIVVAIGIVFGIGNYLGKMEKDREIIKYENNIETLKKENNKLKEAVSYQSEEKKLPTKNIVHLADSTKNKDDSHK